MASGIHLEVLSAYRRSDRFGHSAQRPDYGASGKFSSTSRWEPLVPLGEASKSPSDPRPAVPARAYPVEWWGGARKPEAAVFWPMRTLGRKEEAVKGLAERRVGMAKLVESGQKLFEVMAKI